MRVLHIIDHWGLGGAQRAVTMLVKSQPKQHHVAVLFAHGRQQWPLATDCGLSFLAASYWQLPLLPGRLRRLIKRLQPQLIQVHLNGARFVTALSLVGWHAKPAVIWHEHSGVELLVWLGRLPGWFLLRWQRLLARRVALVVANSHDSYAYVLQKLKVKPPRLETIYYPVDGAQISREANAPMPVMPAGAGGDAPVAGYVGRLVHQKGIEDVAAVFGAISRAHPRCQFWVAGVGPQQSILEKAAAEQGWRNRLFFLGNLDNVYPVMKSMSLVVMPSRYEPFGLVALEALTLGVPVAAYATGGLNQVLAVSPLGFPIPPGNREQLCALAVKLIGQPPARQVPPAGNPFSAEVVNRAWQAAYQRLAPRMPLPAHGASHE